MKCDLNNPYPELVGVLKGLYRMNDILPIHEKIQKERFKRFWTQRELAGACGIKQSVISRMEGGKPTTIAALNRVADAFDMDLVITLRRKK